MLELNNGRLLDKVRARRQNCLKISPKLASKVLKSYILPFVSKKYLTTKPDFLVHKPTHSSKNSKKISQKLEIELEKAQSVLSTLKSKLKAISDEKKSILIEIQNLKIACNESETIYKNLSLDIHINGYSSTLEPSKEAETIELISKNSSLRYLVEAENYFNYIRLKITNFL
jgi:hypothetical protein